MYSPLLFPNIPKSRGFTLVELLVVIAILSILAVAGLATLNPAEILRKSRDSERQATATEIIKALERYNVSKTCNPWETTPGCADTGVIRGVTVDAAAFASGGILEDLVVSQELKASFVNKKSVQDGLLYITEDIRTINGANSVCWELESKQNREALADAGPNSPNKFNSGVYTSGRCRNQAYSGDGTNGRCYTCIE